MEAARRCSSRTSISPITPASPSASRTRCSRSCGARTRCTGRRSATAAGSGRSPSTRTSRRSPRTGAPSPPSAAAPRSRISSPDELEARKSMLDMDPPPHNALRAIVNRDFTPRAVRVFTERIRELFDGVLDEALEQGRGRVRRGRRGEAADAGLRRDARRAGVRPPLPGRARRPDARPGRSRVRDRPRGGGGQPPPAVLQPGGAGDVRVRAQARRRAPRVPARRHRHQAGRGRDRRPAADPARVRRLLPAALRRRQRDHPPLDLPGGAGADREPRAAAAAARRPGAAAARRERDPPLGDAGAPLPPHRDRRGRVRRQDDPRERQARHLVHLGQLRRGGLRPSPTRSTSAATRTRR